MGRLQNIGSVKRKVFACKEDANNWKRNKQQKLLHTLNELRYTIETKETEKEKTRTTTTTTCATVEDSEVKIIKNLNYSLFPKREPEIQKSKWKHPALLRKKGQEYISQTGRVMEKKAIKEKVLCEENCRLKCSGKVHAEDREAIVRTL